jgi:hypothetical protein
MYESFSDSVINLYHVGLQTDISLQYNIIGEHIRKMRVGQNAQNNISCDHKQFRFDSYATVKCRTRPTETFHLVCHVRSHLLVHYLSLSLHYEKGHVAYITGQQ